MSKIIVVVCIAVVLAALYLASGGNEPAHQTGYFKSDNRNRVLVYAAERAMTSTEAKGFLGHATWTQGRLTTAVLFDVGATTPGHLVTIAPSILDANAFWDDGKWDHYVLRLDITPNGLRTFTGTLASTP